MDSIRRDRMARKNFIREKRIYCGKEWLEVDIVPVTNMPEAGKGKTKCLEWTLPY